MIPAKSRSRLVTFRLTPDELENLRVACLMQGARNVSEFARSAVLEGTAPRPHSGAQLLDRFSAVELRLTEMQSAIEHGNEMLRVVLKNLANEKSGAKGA